MFGKSPQSRFPVNGEPVIADYLAFIYEKTLFGKLKIWDHMIKNQRLTCKCLYGKIIISVFVICEVPYDLR